MILLEYEAKSLLQEFGVKTPNSKIAGTSGANISFPFFIKSQVPVGGRGKAGGIAVVHSKKEYDDAVARISTLAIKGHTPKKLLVEEALSIKNEYYLALRINTSTQQIECMAHPQGGVDIEEHDENDFFIHKISPAMYDQIADAIADLFDIPEKSHILSELIKSLYECFTKNDALLLEINPLVLTTEGHLVAADCKMEVDDAALFRHPEWDFEAVPTNSNFVTLNQNGSVATIANGAGLAMATVDAVAAAGIKPANFLDIGGGANEQSVLQAFNEIMKYPNVKAIVINIFAGITRCDEVAKAIIAAGEQIPGLPALCIRLAGTNLEQAKLLLQDKNISLMPDLEACVDAAKEHVA
jgi:succinyl-CoA synthetase beta subunit